MDFFRKLRDHFIPSERNVYRPHLLRRPWLVFFVAVILTAESVFLINLIARESAFNFVAAVLPGEVIALTNGERAQNNAGALTENTLLAQAAQAKAEDMAAKGYFAHTSPDGSEPWVWIKSAGYDYQYAGENLAVKFTDSREVVSAWMASPTHRANIVKPQYREIGIGIAHGSFRGEPATFVVQYFGTPRGVATLLDAQPATLAVSASSDTEQVAGATTAAPTEPEEPAAPQEVLQTNVEPQVSAQPEPSPWSQFMRGLIDSDVQPNIAIMWVLAGVAMLLIVGLILTFFVHIQIQPTDMLVSGAVVAVIALAFVVLNMQTVSLTQNTQAAAVFGAVPTSGGYVDGGAASTVAQ